MNSKSILTADNPDRYVLFPIREKAIWDMYERQRAAFWWDTDVTFTSQDEKDWESLTDEEKFFMENILAFFASADAVVMENLAERFMVEMKLPEVRAYFTVQLMIELIHSTVYSKLIDGYIRDSKRKNELFRANQDIPFVKAKTDWALRWISDKNASLAERLVAFACVEGIYFMGEFCAIFWMKAVKKKLPALTTANYLIARDESMHKDNGCQLYRDYIPTEEKLTQARLEELIRGAVEVEKQFINETLNCSLLGMNKEMMGEYIEFVADDICRLLGHDIIYGSKNPFDFMDRLAFDIKENFFETRVTSYQNPKTTDVCSIDDMTFEGGF